MFPQSFQNGTRSKKCICFVKKQNDFQIAVNDCTSILIMQKKRPFFTPLSLA